MKTKKVIFFCVLVVVAITLALVVGDRRYDTRATYSEFLQQVQSGQVTKATLTTETTGATPVMYILRNGARMQTIVPRDYHESLSAMVAKQVNVEVRNAPQGWSIFVNMTPFLILMAFWLFMMHQMKNRPRPAH